MFPQSSYEKKGQTQFSTKFETEFHAPLKPSVLFDPLYFWNLIPYVTKQGGFWCRLFLTFTDNFNVPKKLMLSYSIWLLQNQ
jgi:hypothetical protein